jgi:hypothetical protein
VSKKLIGGVLLLLTALLILQPSTVIMENQPGWGWTLFKRRASLEGTVLAEESGRPLVSGQVLIDGEAVPISEGRFLVEDLTPGEYTLTIQGPYRSPQTLMVTVKAGQNQLEAAVPCQLSPADIAMLARITHAEAEGEPFIGQVGVAASVLNRVMNPKYPATVTEVVYQRVGGRYQYSPVADGRIRLEPNEKAWRAAYAALAGWDPTEGATGFFNPAKTRDRWVHSRPATTQIGGHVFFN